ncbi:MAG: CU044_5270 family protein [Catenulispora sp.]|nr:CU044_5270 family protein [Catenulispora sp.]
MRRTFTQAREGLAALDPAQWLPERSQAARSADLEAILDGTYRPVGEMAEHFDGRRPLSRRATLTLAGAVTVSAVAVAVFEFGSGTTAAQAATPEALTYKSERDGVGVKARLAAIADRAAAQPDTAGRGSYDHLRYQEWVLASRTDGRQVTSKVVPQQFEQWLTIDGSGKSVRTVPGTDQAPEVLNLSGPGMWAGERPPTDPAALAGWLSRGHPPQNGPEETIVAITDLVKLQVLSPAARAAVLRVLGDVPGLVDQGTTTDRAGRPAVAFAVEGGHSGLPTRYTVLVDPATGAILGHEQTLTRSAGDLNVPVPSVIGYDLFLVAERTDHLG